jgi:PAS domain S-box-containing protein
VSGGRLFGECYGKQIRLTGGVGDPPRVDLGQIVENAPAVISVKDPSGRYLYVNREYEVVTEISSGEALGRTDFDLFPEVVAAIYREDDLRTLQGNSPIHFDEPILVQGDARLYSTVKFRVLDQEEVVGVCGMSVAVAEMPQLEPEAPQGSPNRADAFFGRLLASLTPQEVRVLDHVAAGLSDREIAEKLSLSSGTVRHHVSHLLRKLRKRRTQVIIEMLKRGSP